MPKKLFLSIIICLGTCVFYMGCKSEIENPDDIFFGYEYYPLNIGNEWVYTVDSFLYSNDGIFKDTAHWFIREKIVDVYTVLNEENAFILERSKSKDNLSWKVSDIWTISKSKTELKKTEENLTFIKLVFPAKVGEKWDGNVYIDDTDEIIVYGEPLRPYSNWSYRIEESIDNMQVGLNSYENVIKVREVDETDRLLEYKKSYVYYAENIGLIQEERSILFDNSSDPGDWILKADKGFIVDKKLLSFHIE